MWTCVFSVRLDGWIREQCVYVYIPVINQSPNTDIERRDKIKQVTHLSDDDVGDRHVIPQAHVLVQGLVRLLQGF